MLFEPPAAQPVPKQTSTRVRYERIVLRASSRTCFKSSKVLSFGISILPRFSALRLVWMEMGGIYAVANIRGGGEYGQKWHESGKKMQKQNVFDDFIAAAEYLIESNYWTPCA